MEIAQITSDIFYIGENGVEQNSEDCRRNLYETFERYKLAGGVKIVADYESSHRIANALYKVAEDCFL